MSVAIRSIQHYMYCPRRFALLEINRDWKENVFVTKANLLHEKVHSGEHNIQSKALISISNVWLYNDNIDIFGVADCVEFRNDKNGDVTGENGEKYNVNIVEYKPVKPKDGGFNETDAIQVFAQKLCVDYIWKCNSNAYLYYADVRKRVKLPFDKEYDKYYNMLTELLKGIESIYQSEEIPKKAKGQKCSGCSLSDVCMPLKKHKKNLRDEIYELMEV